MAVEYKGYKAGQAPNNHVWITKDEDGIARMVCHAQCNRPMTDDELRGIVDNYIELTQSGKFDEIYNDEEEGDEDED